MGKKLGKVKTGAKIAASILLGGIMCFGVGCAAADSPEIEIGANGNWYINGTDTGVNASGIKGDKGDPGEKGDKGDKGDGITVEDTFIPSGDITETLKEVTGTQTGVKTGGKFYVDYANLAEEQQAARDLSVEIASEGFVLLKNANNTLPLKGAKALSLFGIHSTKLIASTSGSAGGSTGANGIAESTLKDAMELAGYRVNSSLEAFYKKHNTLGTATTYELPLSYYSNALVSTYMGFNDAAVITLSRQGSEGMDKQTDHVDGHTDAKDHELMLEDNEKDLIKHVKKYFDKVIVLINSSNIMQVPELAADEGDYSVDGIIWVGNTGNNAIEAVGKIISGEVNPSGKTVDIWEKDFRNGPTWKNFATQSQNGLDAYYYYNNEATGYRTVEYREGIYMGYKYYETAAYDLNAKTAGSGDTWYDGQVLYPFGYGLSYTEFEWRLDNVKETATIDKANRTVTMRVNVKNIGDVAGKDVVQVYFSAPYTKGGIEKASTNLVGFAKTDLLQPGQSQTVTVQFTAQDMASYDWNDANDNGFSGYELEAGEYEISACRDSHTPVLSVKRTVAETIKCTTDLTTGKNIENVFVDNYTSVNDSLLGGMISRENGLTLPESSSREDRTIDAEYKALIDAQYDYRSYRDEDLDPWYVEVTPTSWNQTANSNAATIKIQDMTGVDYTLEIKDGQVIQGTDAGSKKWEEFMNQLTWEELVSLVNNGGGVTEIASVGVRRVGASETPLQLSGGTLWVSVPIISATWNQELVYEYGKLIGNEALFKGCSYWQGPAMNLHRSPLSGRNVEYWSQDGVQAALMVVQAVKGVTSKGVTCHLKHMVLNDQETYRDINGGVFTWATEQVIREMYLKPFEACLKDGGSTGIMTSFNRIGNINSQLNHALLVDLVRNEWGSKAVIETDAWQGTYCPLDLMVRAGGNQVLGAGDSSPAIGIEHGTWNSAEKVVYVSDGGTGTIASYTHYANIRARAQEMLYIYCNGNAVQNGYGAVKGSATFDKGCPASVEITFDDEIDCKNFQLASGSELPAGVTLSEAGVITGTFSELGEITFNVTVTADNYLTMTLPVTIKVIQPIHVTGDLEVSAGESIDLTFDTPAYAYGGTAPGAGGGFGSPTNIFNWFELDLDNIQGTPSIPKEDIPTSYPNAGWIHFADVEAPDACYLEEKDIADGFYKTEHAYTYTVTVKDASGNTVEGVTAELVKVIHTGTQGPSYEVVSAVKLSGSIAAAGEYTVEVTLNVPVVPGFGNRFPNNIHVAGRGCSDIQVTSTYTLTVSAD